MNHFEPGDILEFTDASEWNWQGKGTLCIFLQGNLDRYREGTIWVYWPGTIIGNPEYSYRSTDFRLVSRSKMGKLMLQLSNAES